MTWLIVGLVFWAIACAVVIAVCRAAARGDVADGRAEMPSRARIVEDDGLGSPLMS